MSTVSDKNDMLELYTASLMLMLASVDDQLDPLEIDIIKDILIDFFNIDSKKSEQLIIDSHELIKKITDIYEITSFINDSFNKQEKIDLLCCIFEVAYCDKKFHFMERHLINQIANILNINKDELLKAKKEIQDYLF